MDDDGNYRRRDEQSDLKRDRDYDRKRHGSDREEQRRRDRDRDHSPSKRDYEHRRRRRREEDDYSSGRERDRRSEHRDKRDRDREDHRRDRPEDAEITTKLQPNYKQSGLLAKAANTVGDGVVLKYVEPEDAHKPDEKTQPHRLFVFDGDEIIDKIDLTGRSWYLLGRASQVCHITLDGASCSKQHAAIQFRIITTTNKYGEKKSQIKCYLIDLDSSYGTKLNHDEIPKARYVELKNKDMMQFGGITDKQYVLIVG